MNTVHFPACFGFGTGCGKHSTCERYEAVVTHPDRPRITSCRDIRGEYPLYQAIDTPTRSKDLGEHEADGMFGYGAGL